MHILRRDDEREVRRAETEVTDLPPFPLPSELLLAVRPSAHAFTQWEELRCRVQAKMLLAASQREGDGLIPERVKGVGNVPVPARRHVNVEQGIGILPPSHHFCECKAVRFKANATPLYFRGEAVDVLMRDLAETDNLLRLGCAWTESYGGIAAPAHRVARPDVPFREDVHENLVCRQVRSLTKVERSLRR